MVDPNRRYQRINSSWRSTSLFPSEMTLLDPVDIEVRHRELRWKLYLATCPIVDSCNGKSTLYYSKKMNRVECYDFSYYILWPVSSFSNEPVFDANVSLLIIVTDNYKNMSFPVAPFAFRRLTISKHKGARNVRKIVRSWYLLVRPFCPLNRSKKFDPIFLNKVNPRICRIFPDIEYEDDTLRYSDQKTYCDFEWDQIFIDFI